MQRCYRFLLLALLAWGCGEPPPAPPGRSAAIVSLSPFGTQVVIDLGAGSLLVAADAVSTQRPELAGIPTTSLEGFGAFAPTLVLLPPGSPAGIRAGFEAIEIEAHEIDEVAALYLAIGGALGRMPEAHELVRERTRPLATLGAEAFGQRRPRIAALFSVDPLVVAGDHSFASDLIELAGGENVTHGIEEPRLRWPMERLREAAPELIVRVSRTALTEAERQWTRAAVAELAPVGFLALGADPLSFEAALPAARALRKLVIGISAASDAQLSGKISRSQPCFAHVSLATLDRPLE